MSNAEKVLAQVQEATVTAPAAAAAQDSSAPSKLELKPVAEQEAT